MSRKLVFGVAMICVLVFAGSAFAAPPFAAPWITTYDGYLQEDDQGWVLADTLIVVNNPAKGVMSVWIEVFDKDGVTVVEQALLNGGNPLSSIPVNGYGWTTLGVLVNRPTHDPWGFAAGEKFSFRIFTSVRAMPPIVEVKQVIYNSLQEFPGEAIWQAGNIKTWAETCLGGLLGPGVTRVPKKMRYYNTP